MYVKYVLFIIYVFPIYISYIIYIYVPQQNESSKICYDVSFVPYIFTYMFHRKTSEPAYMLRCTLVFYMLAMQK